MVGSPLYRYPSVTILKYHSESHCSNWWYQNGPADQTSGQMVRYFRENTSPSATTCPCRKPYPAWQSIENRTMIVRNEGSLQARWLDGCRSDPVAGNA